MRSPKPTKLRASTLNVKQLKRATGGRGTQCGNVLHCEDCGCVYEAQCAAGGFYGDALYFTGFELVMNCPGCGGSSY